MAEEEGEEEEEEEEKRANYQKTCPDYNFSLTLGYITTVYVVASSYRASQYRGIKLSQPRGISFQFLVVFRPPLL